MADNDNNWSMSVRIRTDPFSWGTKKPSWDVLRLDECHPVVSGNKLYKLEPFLARAFQEGRPGIVTFGGPYSNHIHATAFAAQAAGLPAIGIIRGEQPPHCSPTLADAQEWGMQLRYLSRERYKALHRDPNAYTAEIPPRWLVVPEGGYTREGAQGAKKMLDGIPTERYDRIVCACGTGTMAAGLRMAAHPRTAVIGIPVLKGHGGLENDIHSLIPEEERQGAMTMIDGYHFGGYAKKNLALLQFMKRFYLASGIQTDFVYTAKLMFAVDDLFRNGYFHNKERILAIHSGGLQGNRSLKNLSLTSS
ncbi:MAG: pyridoxal-phosphate dependent enzyme [Bacteroidetes bacterium]|nr:pyridoxal-phosphate dependent enzyme [Bacteroidota bacterium]